MKLRNPRLGGKHRAIVDTAMSVLLLGATAAPGSLQAAQVCTGGALEAVVFRDKNGIPHIRTENEEAAWYALGYEEGRDALWEVQKNIKLFQGRAAERLGDGVKVGNLPFPMGFHVLSDMVVKIYDTHLGGMTESDLMELLKDTSAPGPLQDQLFHNLKAYARGLDDFREHLKGNSGLLPEEEDMRQWLVDHNANWALEETIDVQDVASWGGWAKAVSNFTAAALMDANPHPAPVPPLSASTPSVAIGGWDTDPGTQFLKSVFAPLGLGGSNGMAWSFGFLEEQGVGYAGCVGDQQGAGQLPFLYPNGTGVDEAEFHIYYAHLDVEPAGGTDPGYSTFGFLRHGAGAFFTSHNDNVAFGGSVAAANIADGFLLRLEQNADKSIADPPRYFSYYENGGTGDFVDFVNDSVTVVRKDGPDFVVSFQRAGPFGVVYNTTPFWADNTTSWGASNAFYTEPDPTDPDARVPVVVAYRCPHDNAVDDLSGSDDHHSRLVVGGYRLMRARDVQDVRVALENHDLGYTVDICAVDREGRLYSTLAGTIPQRGVDSELLLDGWTSLSKFDIYDKDGEPVPARWPSDRKFDWQLESDGHPKYLVPGETGNPAEYLPYVYFNPLDSDDEPAEVPYTPGQNDYENPGFVTASNDVVWHFYKKRYQQIDLSDPVNPVIGDNAILDRTLKSWTLYHVWAYGETFEALDKNQQMIDHFLDIDESGNLMDLAEAKEFTVSRDLYVPEDFQSWDENAQAYVPPADPQLATLPVTVRVLKELQNNLSSIEQEADRESRFFKDLWEALWRPQGLWHLKTVTPTLAVWMNLKNAWIDNAASTFYYPNLMFPGTGFENRAYDFEMPEDGALVDFFWEQTWLAEGVEPKADGGVSLSAQERNDLDVALNKLILWDGPVPYQRNASSASALLFEEFKQGFQAANYPHARRFVPVFDGAVVSSSVPYDDADFPNQPQTTIPLVAGALPHALMGDDELDAPGLSYDGEFLLNDPRSWNEFESMAFPRLTWASMWMPQGSLHTITNHLEISEDVYNSLYLPNGTVKSVLSASDVNHIVTFLLDLGGFYSEEGASSPQASQPSTKKDPYDDWMDSWSSNNPTASPHASGYPLTRNMVRVAMLRRLLDADSFINDHGLGTYGEVVRGRAFAYDGDQKWPPDGSQPDPSEGAPNEGYGFAGAVPFPDLEQSFVDGNYTPFKFQFQRGEGFSERFWARPVSTWPLVTFFPNNGRAPESYFWVSPGNRVMAFDSIHFPGLMEAVNQNTLATTHYNDYRRPNNWSTEMGHDSPQQYCYTP